MKKNNGFTLIELIIVMALLSVVLAGAFSILSFGNTVQKMSIDEYEIQSKMRLVADSINRISRKSSATFMLRETYFKESNLNDDWSYIGIIGADEYGKGGSVVSYYPKEGEGHTKTVIAPANDEVSYKILFNTMDMDKEVLKFRIVGFIEGRTIEYEDDDPNKPIGHITIASQIENINSQNIDEKFLGTGDLAAIGFKTVERGESFTLGNEPVALVSLVLDTSGSMDDDISVVIDGETVNKRKISILKDSSKKLISNFYNSEHNHYVSLIPFSTSANGPGSFLNVKENFSYFENRIDSFEPVGGTNTGDGMRRAYYKILDYRGHEDFIDREVSNYIIILVDGVSTFGSITSKNPNVLFKVLDGDINEDYWHWGGNVEGKGNELDKIYGTPYIEEIGSMIKDDGDINVYVIGFGENNEDFRDNLNHIGKESGAAKVEEGIYYFLAGNEDELDIIFGDIGREISDDMWEIYGP